MMTTRLWRAIAAYLRDVSRMARLVSSIHGFVRYATDRFPAVLVRRREAQPQQVRQIALRTGARIWYRVNRGDLQSIREVWLEETYRLPSDGIRKNIVDLGANIGLASIWLARQYACEKLVAVEPVRSNVCVLRQNFRANGIPGAVVEAAIGSTDGAAFFQENAVASNLGHISTHGRKIATLSIPTLLKDFLPADKIDLLKIDIEGAERDLFLGPDISWLARVREIIIEVHPQLVDRRQLIDVLQSQGFEYLVPHRAVSCRSDYFVNKALVCDV